MFQKKLIAQRKIAKQPWRHFSFYEKLRKKYLPTVDARLGRLTLFYKKDKHENDIVPFDHKGTMVHKHLYFIHHHYIHQWFNQYSIRLLQTVHQKSVMTQSYGQMVIQKPVEKEHFTPLYLANGKVRQGTLANIYFHYSPKRLDFAHHNANYVKNEAPKTISRSTNMFSPLYLMTFEEAPFIPKYERFHIQTISPKMQNVLHFYNFIPYTILKKIVYDNVSKQLISDKHFSLTPFQDFRNLGPTERWNLRRKRKKKFLFLKTLRPPYLLQVDIFPYKNVLQHFQNINEMANVYNGGGIKQSSLSLLKQIPLFMNRVVLQLLTTFSRHHQVFLPPKSMSAVYSHTSFADDDSQRLFKEGNLQRWRNQTNFIEKPPTLKLLHAFERLTEDFDKYLNIEKYLPYLIDKGYRSVQQHARKVLEHQKRAKKSKRFAKFQRFIETIKQNEYLAARKTFLFYALAEEKKKTRASGVFFPNVLGSHLQNIIKTFNITSLISLLNVQRMNERTKMLFSAKNGLNDIFAKDMRMPKFAFQPLNLFILNNALNDGFSQLNSLLRTQKLVRIQKNLALSSKNIINDVMTQATNHFFMQTLERKDFWHLEYIKSILPLHYTENVRHLMLLGRLKEMGALFTMASGEMVNKLNIDGQRIQKQLELFMNGLKSSTFHFFSEKTVWNVVKFIPFTIEMRKDRQLTEIKQKSANIAYINKKIFNQIMRQRPQIINFLLQIKKKIQSIKGSNVQLKFPEKVFVFYNEASYPLIKVMPIVSLLEKIFPYANNGFGNRSSIPIALKNSLQRFRARNLRELHDAFIATYDKQNLTRNDWKDTRSERLKTEWRLRELVHLYQIVFNKQQHFRMYRWNQQDNENVRGARNNIVILQENADENLFQSFLSVHKNNVILQDEKKFKHLFTSPPLVWKRFVPMRQLQLADTALPLNEKVHIFQKNVLLSLHHRVLEQLKRIIVFDRFIGKKISRLSFEKLVKYLSPNDNLQANKIINFIGKNIAQARDLVMVQQIIRQPKNKHMASLFFGEENHLQWPERDENISISRKKHSMVHRGRALSKSMAIGGNQEMESVIRNKHLENNVYFAEKVEQWTKQLRNLTNMSVVSINSLHSVIESAQKVASVMENDKRHKLKTALNKGNTSFIYNHNFIITELEHRKTKHLVHDTYRDAAILPVSFDYYQEKKRSTRPYIQAKRVSKQFAATIKERQKNEELIPKLYFEKNFSQIVEKIYKAIERKFELERKRRGL